MKILLFSTLFVLTIWTLCMSSIVRRNEDKGQKTIYYKPMLIESGFNYYMTDSARWKFKK